MKNYFDWACSFTGTTKPKCVQGKTDTENTWRNRNIRKYLKMWKTRQKCFLLGDTVGW